MRVLQQMLINLNILLIRNLPIIMNISGECPSCSMLSNTRSSKTRRQINTVSHCVNIAKALGKNDVFKTFGLQYSDTVIQFSVNLSWVFHLQTNLIEDDIIHTCGLLLRPSPDSSDAAMVFSLPMSTSMSDSVSPGG